MILDRTVMFRENAVRLQCFFLQLHVRSLYLFFEDVPDEAALDISF